MKSRDGKGQRREEKKKEDQKRESLRAKKIQVREKVRKSRNTVLFRWFVAPEGWKVGSLKRRVRSHLAGWEMNNCTLLWREAHLEVKMRKTPQCRTTFGSWDVEKVHAVVAQLEVKMYKTHHVRATFGSWNVKKVHAVVARSTFRSQKCKELTGSEHFWRFRCRFAWQVRGIMHLAKSKQNMRPLSNFLKRWPEWDICRRSGKMFFAWQGQYFRQMEWKNRKTALNFPLLKEVAQSCFVFDVINLETWRSLAEMLRFGCCQVQKTGSLAE